MAEGQESRSPGPAPRRDSSQKPPATTRPSCPQFADSGLRPQQSRNTYETTTAEHIVEVNGRRSIRRHRRRRTAGGDAARRRTRRLGVSNYSRNIDALATSPGHRSRHAGLRTVGQARQTSDPFGYLADMIRGCSTNWNCHSASDRQLLRRRGRPGPGSLTLPAPAGKSSRWDRAVSAPPGGPPGPKG